jgi:hypothetical protein
MRFAKLYLPVIGFYAKYFDKYQRCCVVAHEKWVPKQKNYGEPGEIITLAEFV